MDDKDCESLRRAVGAGDVEFFADWALGQPVVSKIPLVRNFRVLYDSTKFRKKMLLSRILSFVSRIFNNCDDLLNRSMVSASGSSLLLSKGRIICLEHTRKCAVSKPIPRLILDVVIMPGKRLQVNSFPKTFHNVAFFSLLPLPTEPTPSITFLHFFTDTHINHNGLPSQRCICRRASFS